MKQSVTVGAQLLWGGRYGCNNGRYGCTIVMSYIEINKAVSQWLLTFNLCVSVTWPLTCAFHIPCTHTPEIIDMHRGVCDKCIKHDVFTSVKLLTCMFRQLFFKSDVNQNIDRWKCVTIYTLRFTLRPGSLTLRSTACYVTVHTRISNQVSCVKTKSRRRYLAPQLYSQQSRPLKDQCEIAPNMQHDSSMAIVVSYRVRRQPCCVKRNVRYGSQGTHRENTVFMIIHRKTE